ncbi:hypothetical protein B566_EDAN010289 [Ephemera danica]|nr:hypothetical protein B566_EDAN010289 [Ephemera danica]
MQAYDLNYWPSWCGMCESSTEKPTELRPPWAGEARKRARPERSSSSSLVYEDIPATVAPRDDVACMSSWSGPVLFSYTAGKDLLISNSSCRSSHEWRTLQQYTSETAALTHGMPLPPGPQQASPGRAARVGRCISVFLRHLFSNLGLFAIVVGYVLLGALLFESLEADYELQQRGNIKQYRDDCLRELWLITDVKKYIMLFLTFMMDYIPASSIKEKKK